MRNLAHLGKTIATVDNIAGGRVIPGLGAGWMPREYTDFDVPFPNTKERLGQLAEAVEVLTQMWDPDIESVTYDGTYFHTENLVTQPKPPRKPPLLIGGAGEKVTMKLAAKHAVSQQCLVTIADTEEEVGPMIETAQKIFGGHMGNPAGVLALSGTPDQIKERIDKHVELGCTMFIIEFFGRDTVEPAQLFAEKVMPSFR
jgi:alkanesulfonate monooxygenase SsuD/methylene tetrahydromethanopterin reductase-like flavin-dependent oxidoreductase (luciferase family)